MSRKPFVPLIARISALTFPRTVPPLCLLTIVPLQELHPMPLHLQLLALAPHILRNQGQYSHLQWPPQLPGHLPPPSPPNVGAVHQAQALQASQVLDNGDQVQPC